ncbi:LysE family translocator [Shimia ponticola]|uniref:LysE family translocator n=1 Tax=Shimia ponticola TaxID=2582893 RepID=UPI0011BD92E7|nr:LysE family translocator [Shimia ponticola]
MIPPLYIFVFLGLFSPGPNVILLTASGARFGFKPTLPHVLGVAFGVGITAGLTGFGIGALLTALPGLRLVLQVIAAGWILFMAWKLWNAKPGSADSGKDRPWTFFEAVLFQWVNPKVWAIAVAATAYTHDAGPLMSAWLLGTAFAGINLCVCLFWSFAGSLLSYLLGNPSAYRVFMRIMALLLAASAAMVFL